MKAQMSAVPEGEAVVKPQPPKPASYVTHTEKAAVKRDASALRKSDGLKVKITDLQIEIDTFKNKRERATASFVDAADQYNGEIVALRDRGIDLVHQSASLQGEITRLKNKVELLRAESDVVLQAKKQVAQDLAATGILLQAAQQKAEEAGLENQPKIDQLTAKRNKLIERLYHHQLLHPGIFPAEGSKTDA